MTDEAAATSDVSLEIDGHVATIEVHRAPANYFDRDVLSAIADLGEQAHAEGARAIVLCSEGKHFCAGANFGGRSSGVSQRESAAAVYEQGLRIFALKIPVVAAVQGAAVGGGLGLACAADFRVATPETRFEANFSRLGFHNGFGLSVTLPRIVGNQAAAQLLLTGLPVKGEQAHAIGLADMVVPVDQVRDEAIAFARTLAGAAPLAVGSIRATLRAELLAQLPAALEHELDEQEWLWQTEDSKAGIAASLNRTEPIFVGH